MSKFESQRIPMVEATQHFHTDYGVDFISQFVYRITGKGPNRPSSAPHRVKLWDNTIRPNTNPDAPGAFNVGRVGEGRYVSPHRKGTDSPTEYTASGESTMICADTRFNTGQPGSGQVWSDVKLAVGDRVRFTYPNGSESQTHVIEFTFNNGVTFRPDPEWTGAPTKPPRRNGESKECVPESTTYLTVTRYALCSHCLTPVPGEPNPT